MAHITGISLRINYKIFQRKVGAVTFYDYSEIKPSLFKIPQTLPTGRKCANYR
jgi:hypothetical protein